MLLEKELVDFMNAQNPSKSINEIIDGLELLKQGLNDFKQELSESLPIFFMSGDKKSIERCLKYGEQVDNAILYLNSTNLKSKDKNSFKKTHLKSQNDQVSSTLTTVDNKTEGLQKPIKLIIVDNNFCPYCKEKLLNTKTAYTLFKDRDKKQMEGTMITPTFRCEKCNKYFIDKKILNIIDISKTNIEPIYITKKCIQCGEPVYNNSNYCWEHYKYHNAESK